MRLVELEIVGQPTASFFDERTRLVDGERKAIEELADVGGQTETRRRDLVKRSIHGKQPGTPQEQERSLLWCHHIDFDGVCNLSDNV